MARAGRNSSLGSGVNRLSKSALKSKKGYHQRLNKSAASPKAVVDPASTAGETKTKKVGGSKNGEQRLVPVNKAAKFYPAEDTRQAKQSRKSSAQVQTKLRKSITPGTVLILLAGKYRGKRVVALKQLDSGLLLVSGPFKLNGVPIRRVNQAYVIATSTKVDASSISIPESINDAFFAKAKAAKTTKEGEFFGEGKDKAPVSDDKKSEQKVSVVCVILCCSQSDQQSIDDALVAAVKKVDNLAQYLKAPWGLSRSDRFHELKF